MGQILWVEGGARDPSMTTLFKISDVVTAVIRWVNADCTQKVLMPCDI